MKFLDSVTASETPKLLSDLLALKGYSGEPTFYNVTVFTGEQNSVYFKKKLTNAETAPVTDGTVGIPIPADGLLKFNKLDTQSIWVFTLTGLGTKQAYFVEDQIG